MRIIIGAGATSYDGWIDFHYKYRNEADGMIGRSLRFDTRNSVEKLGMVSIIIDAKKPIIMNHY